MPQAVRETTMNYATLAIERLREGQHARIKPHGNSMRPRVNDGDLVTLAPAEPATLKAGDIVLVRCKGSVLLHLIKATDGSRFLIGNNHGGINGWVGPSAIYGIATTIEHR